MQNFIIKLSVASVFFSFIVVFPASIHADSLLKPNIDDDEYFSETYTLFADLENGAYIYGQIGVSNIGPGNKRGICRILVSVPNSEPFNRSLVVGDDEWSYSDDEDQIFQVKDCRLRASVQDKTLSFFGKLKNSQINIILNAYPKKNKTPFDRLLLNDGYYHSDILIPWATATVSYRIDKTIIQSKGYGYADHSRSTLLPAKIANQWVRFRAINNGNSIIILARQAERKKIFEGWTWAQNKNGPQSFQQLSLSKKMINKQLHWQISIKDTFGSNNIHSTSRLIRYAPMEENGVLTKMISYFIGNPVTYTYRATLVLSSGAEIKGILEVARIDGE